MQPRRRVDGTLVAAQLEIGLAVLAGAAQGLAVGDALAGVAIDGREASELSDDEGATPFPIADAASLALSLDAETDVTFVYDDESHFVTAIYPGSESRFATIAGTIQPQLGCAASWAPACRSS